ncbi:MAG: hypothetical protein AB7J40_04540 [Candidatus Altimarinota bacterium]
MSDEWNGWRRSALVIGNQVLEDSIPLSLTIQKALSSHPERPSQHGLTVYLWKSNILARTPSEWTQSFTTQSENGIGGHMYNIVGNTFVLRDRQIYPHYRNQGFGNMVLQAAEDYIQLTADEIQEEQISTVGAAQIDVICWLWNRGYRPLSSEDENRLARVLNGDQSLCIGQKKYVFEKDIPPEERTQDNMEKAFRIHFEKRFRPRTSSSIRHQQGQFSAKIHKLLK